MPIMLGQSPVFRSALALLQRYAICSAQVLIEGETGTGKELAAREIHYASPRRDRPFVPVNCGALQDSLIESELFGHVRGAFTDARNAQVGVVEHARDGTLFLDEVEALSPKAQVTLLRFLQDSEYRPVGGTPRTSTARIVAATNCSLGRQVASGGFRSDLFYRLTALHVHLPPLRERDGDIALLAEHFLRITAQRAQGPIRYWDDAALRALSLHSWPGNVRELENLVLRAYTLSDGDTVTIEALVAADPAIACAWQHADSGRTDAAESFRQAKAHAIAAFERSYLEQVLQQAHGNVTQAARLAGKDRRALGKLLKKYGIAPTLHHA